VTTLVETKVTQTQHGYGSSLYLWWVIFLLTMASTISIIDRQVLNVMIGPVKRDLGGLSDIQVSLIMGFAFTFFYTIMSYPAGWISDRYNRRNLMAAGIVAWSMMTMLCGMASTYWQLFFARMGVGVGEATLGPASNSTLADYFKPTRLPLAIGIVSAAPFIGQGLANIIGAPLVDYLETVPNIALPVVGEVYSWQMVFLIIGAPGILIGALMMTIREPARQGKMSEETKAVPFSEVWAFLMQRKKLFFFLFAAYLGLSIQGWSLFSWIVEFYIRDHGWTRTEIGLIYGTIAMVVGIGGSISGGAFAGYMIARGYKDATLRIVFWGTCALLPLAFALTLVPDPWVGIWILVPVTFFMATPPGLMMATLQSVCPNELRGQAVAFYLISVNFLAYTFAPSLPPVLTRLLFGGEEGLGAAISFLSIFTYGSASLCLYLSLKHYRDALDIAQQWSENRSEPL
jgi:predicted MFS family arabinose efflux permease